jgi:hypothetical protein
MKKNNRVRIQIVALTVLIICSIIPALSFAQPGGGGGVPCDPLDPTCPIDGGVLFLLSAGIGIGAKRFKKK